MTVRAKVQLVEITRNAHGPTKLKFEPRYDDKIPEDQRFQQATPWGSFEMQVDNPAALGQFNLAGFYYADFTPAT